MVKPPARRVGKKASNKEGSFWNSGPSFEDSKGVDIDFPDLYDRIRNGNQFEEGAKTEGKYFILQIVFA